MGKKIFKFGCFTKIAELLGLIVSISLDDSATAGGE